MNRLRSTLRWTATLWAAAALPLSSGITDRAPVLAGVAPAPASAQVAAAGLEPVTTVEGITEYRLDNGLKVLLFPDESKNTITVNITYFVGSRHEAYGETGMAHLLEHLVFKGTPDHPDIPAELTERGAFPNGTTWYDRTNYFETFPASADNLEWALDLEADRMVNSFISAEDLESEMTVVRNEMESGENNPFRMTQQRVMSTQYIWHNYGKSTIGARSDVESVPIDRLQGFYRKYYQPDNALLMVAGNFDQELALELVQEKFGAIPAPERTGENILWPTYTREPVQDGERSVTVRRTGDTKLVMHAYHVAPGSHPDFAAVQALAFVLGDTPSGRLYKRLVEEEQIASNTLSQPLQLREASPLLFGAIVPLSGEVDAADAAMAEVATDLEANPVTEAEVRRARTSLLSGIERSFNDSQRLALGISEWAAMGDWRLFFINRDRIEALTAADVQRAALTYLKPSNRTVGRFIPTDEPDRAEIPDVPDVAAMVEGYTGREAVAAGESFEATPENIESRVVRTEVGGMEVALLPKETRGDRVVARMTFRHGNLDALRGRSTDASFAGGMLMRGTTERSRQELMDTFDSLQAQVFVGGGDTSASVSIETIRENLPEVLRVVAEVLKQPAFDAGEFEILKNQRVTGIESQLTEPQPLAFTAFQRALSTYPEDDPRYVPTLEEQLERTRAATLDGARAFWTSFYGAGNATASFVGDFDPTTVQSILEEEFAGWTAEVDYARIESEYRENEPGTTAIETPDKANSVLIAGHTVRMSDDDEDYPALALANFMLGGGFLNSRLATRIRQEEGLSYGVQSQFAAPTGDETGLVLAFAISAPENTDKVQEAMLEEIRKVIDDGFTAEEIQAAKTGWIDQRRNLRGNDAALAGQLNGNLFWDRTYEYDAELEAAVRSLSAEEIQAAFARYVDPDRLTFIKAGDFAATRVPIG